MPVLRPSPLLFTSLLFCYSGPDHNTRSASTSICVSAACLVRSGNVVNALASRNTTATFSNRDGRRISRYHPAPTYPFRSLELATDVFQGARFLFLPYRLYTDTTHESYPRNLVLSQFSILASSSPTSIKLQPIALDTSGSKTNPVTPAGRHRRSSTLHVRELHLASLPCFSNQMPLPSPVSGLMTNDAETFKYRSRNMALSRNVLVRPGHDRVL